MPLTSGNTPGVVRVGDTVRRPLNPGSARIHRLLACVRHFQAVIAPPDPGAMDWALAELAHLERNADLFRAHLPA